MTSTFFIEHARTDLIPWELFCFDRRTVSDNKRCGFLFHSSAKERAKTRTNFETNFTKDRQPQFFPVKFNQKLAFAGLAESLVYGFIDC